MSKNIYTGVDGNARKVKKIYLGVGNTARKVKKIYIGVNGTARQCWASAFDFSYTGNYKFSGNPEGDWAISFLSGGTLTLRSVPTPIDVFCVEGGYKGSKGTHWDDGYTDFWYGGAGGRGGKCNKITGLKVNEGEYYIRVGGPEEDSQAFGVRAIDGSSGAGYGGGGGEWDGGRGGDGAYAFFDSSFTAPGFSAGYRFGAGGGGAAGAKIDSSGVGSYGTPGAGGSSGGGRGCRWTSDSPSSGAANSGGGGGGGAYSAGNNIGSGGSGVVVIRNAR